MTDPRAFLDDDPIPDQTVQRRDALLRQVPARFQSVTFDSYVEPLTPSQAKALRAVRKWVAVGADQGVMLALVGPVGVGKSHLLWAAARAFAEQGTGFFAIPWYRYADNLRGTSLQITRSERERLYGSRILLLDEVRKTANTDTDETELTKLACAAYDNAYAALITSNADPLDTLMGKSAASRFIQLRVDGPDRRQPK